MMIKKRNTGLILLLFPAIFYLCIVFMGQHFSRYALPLVPFAAMGTAYFLFEVFRITEKKKWFCIFVITAFLGLALIKSVQADRLFSSADTRTQAALWIEQHIPAGSSIACDSTFFRPAMEQSYGQLKEKYALLKRQPALAAPRREVRDEEALPTQDTGLQCA